MEMSEIAKSFVDLPPAQQAIRAKCLHPSGNFVEFKKEEIEQSIPARFEEIVRRYPDRIAVKTAHHSLTYAELDAARTVSAGRS
jgi:non-ribosomal peptide synthetase component F